MCAALRSTSSQVPRPDESEGIDDSPKITAAQTTTGPQSANLRIRGAMIGSAPIGER
jgi:hypothetical protein